jgi:dihydroorotase
MKLLIKKATIINKNAALHLQTKDIYIENGIIAQIADNIDKADVQTIAAPNTYVSVGFSDIFSDFSDPGYEYKETLATGAAAALKGGYTTVMLVPNTQPCIENKTGVEYMIHESKNLAVNIIPIGAITHKTEGAKLTEMIEMQEVGAGAFSDGWQSVQQAAILLKALQYVKAFDGTIIDLPYDASLTSNGFMNEGIVSTQIGLMGIPAIAEEMIVARNIQLCAYANSKLHITGISTAKSLALIIDAKQKGIQVTCSVAPYHLLLSENELQHYNTNAKVLNPLRTTSDVEALQKGLLNGDIDCVSSHHRAQDMDNKKCEFAYAAYGVSTIEHTFNAIATIPNITAEILVNVLSHHANHIFNISNGKIIEGEKANVTVFTLNAETEIESQNMICKSKNTIFDGKKLNGKILATINNNQQYIA